MVPFESMPPVPTIDEIPKEVEADTIFGDETAHLKRSRDEAMLPNDGHGLPPSKACSLKKRENGEKTSPLTTIDQVTLSIDGQGSPPSRSLPLKRHDGIESQPVRPQATASEARKAVANAMAQLTPKTRRVAKVACTTGSRKSMRLAAKRIAQEHDPGRQDHLSQEQDILLLEDDRSVDKRSTGEQHLLLQNDPDVWEPPCHLR